MTFRPNAFSTLGAVAVAATLLATAARAESTCQGAETLKPGDLTVAYNGDMPGTGTKDGKLQGIDGEIMTWVADKAGLKVDPQLMEWSAEIESVKSHRVDIMHGMMGWNKPRTEVIAMTDPIYYAGALMTQKKGAGITKLDQVKKLRAATVQGFGWVPQLQSLNPDLKLYDTSDAMVRDLVAGRIDVAFADPPLIQYISEKQPNLNIESIPVNEPYDQKLSLLTGKYEIVFGMSKDAAPKLQGCINQAIADLWKTCTNLKIANKYGFSNKYWFGPPTINDRAGVDRPADWKLPELGSCQ